MKFFLIALFIASNAWAYTSSPADNNRHKDPAWPILKGEKREPASSEGKSHKHTKESKKSGHHGDRLKP